MDIKLNYIEKGTGEALILLHGNGENYEYFTNQIEYFSEKYRVIALDTRGHGKSERGSAPFTIRQFAEDLFDFINQREIEKAHILGFSDGGNIALCFALKHPEKVNRLILNGANLNGYGVKARFQLPIVAGYKFLKLFRSKNPEALKKSELLGLMVNDPDISPSELQSLAMPVLVIAGNKDMIRTGHTRLIAKSIKNSRLVLMKGDHFIASKQPEKFNSHIEDFLSK